jgi:hypothetical protein
MKRTRLPINFHDTRYSIGDTFTLCMGWLFDKALTLVYDCSLILKAHSQADSKPVVKRYPSVGCDSAKWGVSLHTKPPSGL